MAIRIGANEAHNLLAIYVADYDDKSKYKRLDRCSASPAARFSSDSSHGRGAAEFSELLI